MSIEHYQPLREIRTNHRFKAYEGCVDNRRVFVKQAADERLRGRLFLEASGLLGMQQLDPLASFYHVPAVIEASSDYLVTEWVDGHPMNDDFASSDTSTIDRHLSYLADLYAFIDGRSSGVVGVTRFNQPGQETNVNKSLRQLREVNSEDVIDPELIKAMATYITATLPRIDTRYTNGDLQPANIMITDHERPTMIDCESCSWLWPRHYNTVNLVFNYHTKYPDLSDKLDALLYDYCQRIGIDPQQSIDSFNISAAMRCMQISWEHLTAHARRGDNGPRLQPVVRDYVTQTMGRIAGGKLFVQS